MDLILKKNIELNFNCCAANNTTSNLNKNKTGYNRNLLLNSNCCSDNNENIILLDAHNNKNRNNLIKNSMVKLIKTLIKVILLMNIIKMKMMTKII